MKNGGVLRQFCIYLRGSGVDPPRRNTLGLFFYLRRDLCVAVSNGIVGSECEYSFITN